MLIIDRIWMQDTIALRIGIFCRPLRASKVVRTSLQQEFYEDLADKDIIYNQNHNRSTISSVTHNVNSRQR